MTLYLLDTNVLREMHPAGNANVRVWLAGIDDHRLRLSVVTIHESRLGIERERKRRETKGDDLARVI